MLQKDLIKDVLALSIEGFLAATGWDAASGYGSPDYAKLSTYALDFGKKQGNMYEKI